MNKIFIGMKIGKALVLERVHIDGPKLTRTKKEYRCLCDCGSEVFLSFEQLTRNKVPACYRCGKSQKILNLIDRRFGKLKVLELDLKSKKWKCLCDCGRTSYIRSGQLLSGHSKSCGCSHKTCNPRMINLIGKRFGRLLVIDKDEKSTFWLCKCDCGNIKKIYVSSLMSGASKSCGCLRKEMLTGENNKGWKGGISERIKKLKHQWFFYKWSKEVRKRDNFLCKRCKSSQKLHAHHIINFAFDQTKALNLENGITLCESCHKLFHKIYGKKENNATQILEFLSKTY